MNASDFVIRTSGLSISPLIAFWGITLEETTANHPRVSTVDMKETDGYTDARIVAAYIHRGKFVVHTSICL